MRLVPFDNFFNCRIITTYRTSILVPTYVPFFQEITDIEKECAAHFEVDAKEAFGILGSANKTISEAIMVLVVWNWLQI